jgi:hypothetical protein
LEQQLLSYPKSKRWDVMDAFAYVIEILEMGLRYFSSSHEVDSYTAESIESEFRCLYSDDDFRELNVDLAAC